jgi:acetyl esterase/lipase
LTSNDVLAGSRATSPSGSRPSRPEQRTERHAAPLQATLEQLAGLPPALVISDEADVVRDEGETYANKLREAGNDVPSLRVLGMVHDFLLLDSLRATKARMWLASSPSTSSATYRPRADLDHARRRRARPTTARAAALTFDPRALSSRNRRRDQATSCGAC